MLKTRIWVAITAIVLVVQAAVLAGSSCSSCSSSYWSSYGYTYVPTPGPTHWPTDGPNYRSTYPSRPPIIAQCEVPVVLVIDKYAEIDCTDAVIELYEKYISECATWWEGYTTVVIWNNFCVDVLARIEPYLPDITCGRNNSWRVAIESDPMGLDDDTSIISLHPYPGGIDIRVYAAVENPNLALRPSSPFPQRVATVYITLTDC